MEWHGYFCSQQAVKPYYTDEFVTLYHADCREVLPQLTVTNGFSFTGPPYNVGKNYGTWNDKMPAPAYMEFCREWIGMLKARCQELCVYQPMLHLPEYWAMLGREYRQIAITWAPGGAMRDGWVNVFVSMLTNAKPKLPIPDNWHNVQTRGLGAGFQEWDRNHPGYTSEDITGRALDGLCAEDTADTVIIEPFAGSGTVLLCAKQRRLKVIGIEIDEFWCEHAARRCEEPAPAQRVPNLWKVKPL